MNKRKIRCCLLVAALITLNSFAAGGQTVHAADVTAITNQLLTAKDKLLAEKQRLSVIRDRLQIRWNEWDYTLRQAETSLRWNVSNSNWLMSQRSRALAELAAIERSRGDVDYAIKRISDETLRVDQELTRFMAYRSSTM